MKFDQQFIRKYGKVSTLISDLLKKAGNSRRSEQVKWDWTREVFWMIKTAFTDAPILKHFEPAELIIVQTDASGFARAGILNQYDGFRIPRLVNFDSRTCSSTGQHYNTSNWDILAIVETMKQLRHCLEGANHQGLIQCDHKTLEYIHR